MKTVVFCMALPMVCNWSLIQQNCINSINQMKWKSPYCLAAMHTPIYCWTIWCSKSSPTSNVSIYRTCFMSIFTVCLLSSITVYLIITVYQSLSMLTILSHSSFSVITLPSLSLLVTTVPLEEKAKIMQTCVQHLVSLHPLTLWFI